MSTREHEPDPRFAEHLEWQIESALRREDRFAAPVRSATSRGLRLVRSAALVLASLTVGAAGVVANEHVQSAQERAAFERQRELLVAQCRVKLELAQRRVKYVKDAAQRTQALFDQGVVSESEVIEERLGFEQAVRETERLLYDLEEIEATGAEPNDALTAPLVNGQDFVAARLELVLAGAEERVQPRKLLLDRSRQLYEHGLAPSDGVLDEELALARTLADAQLLRDLLDLRFTYLRGEETAERLALLEMVVRAENTLELQRLDLDRLKQIAEIHRLRVQSGVAMDDGRAEAELAEARAQVELTDIERVLLLERLKER